MDVRGGGGGGGGSGGVSGSRELKLSCINLMMTKLWFKNVACL